MSAPCAIPRARPTPNEAEFMAAANEIAEKAVASQQMMCPA
eukprot:CAMPEP_0115124290 /NCGR_PEP_ID=MMETSP0227-20121206/48216_1 /TAXON_ID=89957 /ORGANISM="Polarella glacialis, Strain CCMP 1383" /LENGTH=40 /DNA_ID= /DNA_START= /DNA_END= /DNA_ORIENTATION=